MGVTVRFLFSLIRLGILAPILLLVSIAHFYGDSLPYLNVVGDQVVLAGLIAMSLIAATYHISLRTAISLLYLYLSMKSVEFLPEGFLYLVLFLIIVPKQLFGLIVSAAERLFALLVQMHSKQPLVFLSIATFLATLAFYSISYQSYFEGDEWIFFRYFTPLATRDVWLVSGFVDTIFSGKEINLHMAPLAHMIFVIQYKLFQLDFSLYLTFSLILHSVVVWSLAFFTYQLTRNKTLAVLSSFLFLVNAQHSQAVTWVITSVYTELAVLFGLVSLGFLLKALRERSEVYLNISLLALLLGLLSKEIALSFLFAYPVVYFTYRKLKSVAIGHVVKYSVVLCLFGVLQLHNLGIFEGKNASTEMSTRPIAYTLFDKLDSLDGELLLYRTLSFTFKSLSQSVIPEQVFTFLSEEVTRLAFPYFNQEAEVRGTTYLLFTQNVMPELLSFVLGVIVLALLLQVREERWGKLVLSLFFLGIIPIVAITLKFPWWGYSAVVDSRHLYHLTPFVSIILASLIISVSRYISSRSRLQQMVPMVLTILVFIAVNYASFHAKTRNLQEEMLFNARREIVTTLQREISPVPKKLVLFTSSNASYYGFANEMLPFQTAFSHILPVIFNSVFHNEGQQYPESFFTKEYLQGVPGGLVTQGYYESEGYGLGYFLDEKKLIKAMELNDIDSDSVYFYDFDGVKNILSNSTEQSRHVVQNLLEDRKQFSDWARYGSLDHHFSFQADPEWSVQVSEDTYRVADELGNPLVTIRVIENSENMQFSDFVLDQATSPTQKYKTITQQLDFDLERVVHYYDQNPNTWYLVAGNNLQFYSLTFFNKEKMNSAIRTFEFIDDAYDEISAP